MHRTKRIPLVMWIAVLSLIPWPGCLAVPWRRCRDEGWSAPRDPVTLVPEPYVPSPHDSNEAVHLTTQEDLRSQSSLRVSQIYYFNECDHGHLSQQWSTTVIGLLENNGPTHLQLGQLLIDFKDAMGSVLATEEVRFPSSVFAPGSRASFDTVAYHESGAGTPSVDWTEIGIRVQANPVVVSEAERMAQRAPSATLVTTGLTMTKHEYATGDLYYVVTGTVASRSPSRSNYALYVGLFDTRGELVGAGDTIGSPSDPTVKLVVGEVRGPADRFEIYCLP